MNTNPITPHTRTPHSRMAAYMGRHQARHTTITRYMQKALIALLATTLFLVACDDDEPRTISVPQSSQNSNDTEQEFYSGRLEIPRLKGGNNLFVVHSTAQHGVNYCVEWDCDKRAQRWSAFAMYSTNSTTSWNRNNWRTGISWMGTSWTADPFQEDPDLPAAYRTTLEDYRNSQPHYDRGHICASADRLNSMDANGQTFFLSNIQPQLNGFNTGTWLNLENKLRKWNVASFRDTLYVVKGGSIDNGNTLATTSTGLTVPAYFFMAILCKNSKTESQWGYKAIGFWLKHESKNDENLKSYAVSIDELEEKTGIDFFCNLPDEIEEVVEKNLVTSVWQL